MSKQDTHFFNVFSVIIGLLVTVAILILAFAKIVAARTQAAHVYVDPAYAESAAERIKPMVNVAVEGQDNTSLKIAGPVGASTIALAIPKDGTALYESVCKTCHATGLSGAPKVGDKADWGPRIAQGKDMLYEHAIKGYRGKKGMMPAKGSRPDLSDELIKSGVDYLVSLEK